jgi:hypothetical protein
MGKCSKTDDARKQVLRDFSNEILNSPHLEETAIRKICTDRLTALKEESTKCDSNKFTILIKNRLANRDKEPGLLDFLLHKIHSLRDYAAG